MVVGARAPTGWNVGTCDLIGFNLTGPALAGVGLTGLVMIGVGYTGLVSTGWVDPCAVRLLFETVAVGVVNVLRSSMTG